MTNIVNLSGKQATEAAVPNPEVIKAIEELLQLAQDGQIQHFIAVFSDGKGPPCDLYAGAGEARHAMALIGGMELCKHTMLMSFYQETMRHTDFT